jgi:hypothetical protein
VGSGVAELVPSSRTYRGPELCVQLLPTALMMSPTHEDPSAGLWSSRLAWSDHISPGMTQLIAASLQLTMSSTTRMTSISGCRCEVSVRPWSGAKTGRSRTSG